VDCELDFGGRTNGTQGLTEGLPRILDIFRANNIRAIFFVSSELALDNRGIISRIKDQGHVIGSHGHFHIKYKDTWRADQDRQISNRLLSIFNDKYIPYRAPHFYYQHEESLYSYPNNHVSLLKYTWFGGKIPREPIFYIHPFDIVKAKGAPNLFCKVLYAKPDVVFDNLIKLTRDYPGRKKIKG